MSNYFPAIKKSRSKKKIITKFSTCILINNYTHLGFKRSHLHQSFRKAALGFHSNITIINPSFTLSNLRYISKFILNLLLKNNKVVYVVYYAPTALASTINFGGNYFIFNKWPAGLLSNPYTILTSKMLDLPYNYYPHPANAVVVLNSDPENAFLISYEAKTTLIPCFCFSDSVFDLDFISYWVPTNTKSGYSKLFYLLYVEGLSKRSDLVKRNYFLRILREEKQIYAKEYWATRTGFSRATIRKVLKFRREQKLKGIIDTKPKVKLRLHKPSKKKPNFRRRPIFMPPLKITKTKKPIIKKIPTLQLKIKKDYKKTWRK